MPVLLFVLIVLLFSRSVPDLLAPPTSSYNIEEIISTVNIQFCTIVEIGQSYCSLFLEFRSSPVTTELNRDNVAELYLGTCECSRIRNWEFCSVPLRKTRPYECSFEEALPTVNSSARVHRRLCDATMMATVNDPCDCNKQLAERTQYPVQGFLTCYRAPMPMSICSTHSVCGVAMCAAKDILGLALVQCDPNCRGRQPVCISTQCKFCEDPTEVTSKAPMVNSIWSDWTPAKRDIERLQVDEAICLEKATHAPAFDCLGPGSYCCPKECENCRCEVTTTMAEMKVTRYIAHDHTIQQRGFFKKQLNGIAAHLSQAKSQLFGHDHINYSLIYGTGQPNKRVVYQLPRSCGVHSSQKP